MTIATPCTKICIIDPVSGLCRGCARSLDEIAGWTSLSDRQRAQIMAELPQRLKQLNRPPMPATSST
jgi:predicted Fe-S protein YdhL (DUF1289 family)